MKEKSVLKVNNTKITFTKKELTSWGGLCAVIGKCFEVTGFKEWIQENIPIVEKSPNAKGVVEKVILNRKVFSKKGEVMHRLKTLRLKIFAIPAIYIKASGIEILRLGVIDKRLRGKICYLMQKIQGLNLILGNCNAFG